jgi:hypothetical protein
MPIANVFPESTGGGTITVSDGKPILLAKVDFSTQANVDMVTEGDYVFTTAAGSSVSSLTIKSKYGANVNTGAGGYLRVNGGYLECNVPSTATVPMGLGGWASPSSPFIAFDIKAISSFLPADTYCDSTNITLDFELESTNGIGWNGTTWSNTTYVNTYFGFGCNGMASVISGAATKPSVLWGMRTRSGDTTSGYFGYVNSPPWQNGVWSETGVLPSNWSSSAAAFQPLAGAPSNFIVSYSGGVTCNWIKKGTAISRTHKMQSLNGSQPLTSNGTITPQVTSEHTNDVWGLVMFSRTFSTGTGLIRIKSISVYEAKA